MNIEIPQKLKQKFNIINFRSSQEKIINDVINQKNCLVLMPTGMGKSLCYQLPAMLLDGLTVVISPLIALMKDQADSLKARGIDAEYINSSLSKSERIKRYKHIKEGRYKIIFVAPERFLKNDFVEVIQSREISLLAVDEAHCASQWGNDFRPNYSQLFKFRKILGNPVTIALTATATKQVQDDIILKLGLTRENINIYNEGINRPNLHLSCKEVIDNSEKFDEILDIINNHTGNKIIYFSLIKSLEAFASYLDLKKILYSSYHGKLPPEKRKKVQKYFMNSSNCLMLATNAFGMGIDKSDIRVIIHSEIPDSIESYYQEIGRAGRDGKNSKAYLFYSQNDLGIQMEFLNWRNPDIKFIKTAYNLMKNLGTDINSLSYEELQEKLVFKNRGDHRLRTVLNLFDRFNVTEGSFETANLKIINPIPEELLSEEVYSRKLKNSQMKLYQILQYAKTDSCRREFIHNYFDLSMNNCGNCDNCPN